MFQKESCCSIWLGVDGCLCLNGRWNQYLRKAAEGFYDIISSSWAIYQRRYIFTNTYRNVRYTQVSSTLPAGTSRSRTPTANGDCNEGGTWRVHTTKYLPLRYPRDRGDKPPFDLHSHSPYTKATRTHTPLHRTPRRPYYSSRLTSLPDC